MQLPTRIALLLGWKTGDNVTRYRITFRPHEPREPTTSFRVEKLHADELGRDSWQRLSERTPAEAGLVHMAAAIAMPKLVEMALDWGERLHDYVRDTGAIPEQGGLKTRPFLNRETEVFEHRVVDVPPGKLKALPPHWDMTDRALVIDLGVYEPGE